MIKRLLKKLLHTKTMFLVMDELGYCPKSMLDAVERHVSTNFRHIIDEFYELKQEYK